MCGNCTPCNIETTTALHNFSVWLSRRMKKDGITNTALAQYIGCERKVISAWIQEQRFPKLDQLVLVYSFFGYKTVLVPFSMELDHGTEEN